MTNTTHTLPTACVFSISVDPEAVEVTWTPGRIFDVTAHRYLTGRHEERAAGVLMAVEAPDADGVISRASLDGRVTDSAHDAVLWASELAIGNRGEFRRALEIPHAVILSALDTSALEAEVLTLKQEGLRLRELIEAQKVAEFEQTACTLCRCNAVDMSHGFPVCNYHQTHGEDEPACPVCTAPALNPDPASEVPARIMCSDCGELHVRREDCPRLSTGNDAAELQLDGPEPPEGYVVRGTEVQLPNGTWVEAEALAASDVRHEGRCPVLAAWMHALTAWHSAALSAGFQLASPRRLEARAAIRDGAVIVYVYEGGGDRVGPVAVRGGTSDQRHAVLSRLRALGLCADGHNAKAAGLRWLPVQERVDD